MERWKEIFVGKIPNGVYQVQMINGEKQGLIVELSNDDICILIKFGLAQAVQMLDEGIVQCNLYSEIELAKYREDSFKNVIYEVQNGSFGKQINDISGGYGEILGLRHYIIITQNYNIDIVTEWEPSIEFNSK